HSSDSGATWTRVGSLTSTGSRIALGAPAPGQTMPAIYIYGTLPGTSSSVTSLTRNGGIATLVTSAPTGWVAGQLITVSGASPANYNGSFTITSVINPTTFQYSLTGGPDTASGSITASSSSFQGFYRSDDGGNTWVLINDVNHQWGGFQTFDNGGAFGLMAA